MGFSYAFIIAAFVFSFWLVEKHDYSDDRKSYVSFWTIASVAMIIYPLFMDGLWKLLILLSICIFIAATAIESKVYYR